jgi:ATP-binding cassette subfamily C (CFTR/MRP) protein 10
MRRCRYEEVIKACALDVDIQGMQGNDLAEIGEQGLNLSGGQRARLALARYLTLENFLLFLSEVLH